MEVRYAAMLYPFEKMKTSCSINFEIQRLICLSSGSPIPIDVGTLQKYHTVKENIEQQTTIILKSEVKIFVLLGRPIPLDGRP